MPDPLHRGRIRLLLSEQGMIQRLGREEPRLEARVDLGIGRGQLEVEFLHPGVAPGEAEKGVEALHG